MVDNKSKDNSWTILRDWASTHENMSALSRRCTMGEGREIAFRRSQGRYIMVLDTDVVYGPFLGPFVTRYLESQIAVSVQAIYCGVFPRFHWVACGGRRSLNTNEDVDMWVRLWRKGWMRWYPVALGENLKHPSALGAYDHLSERYSKGERLARLLRREWDLAKTSHIRALDLSAIIRENTIDLGLGPMPGLWPQDRGRLSRAERAIDFVRNLRQVLQS